MYDTKNPALRGHAERNVHAWMRAAAYAAGTAPEDEHFGEAPLDGAEQPALEVQRHQGGLLGDILVGLRWLDRRPPEATLAAQASARED